MADTPGIGLSDLLSALKRRAWVIALCVLIIAPLAAGVAYVLPPVYSAKARILIEGQQIPDELARSTVTASAAERIELIKQRLMTRRNLIGLIEQFDLYSDAPNLSLPEKIERLRASTAFESIQFNQSRRGPVEVSAFTITFEANQPVLSASIANQFVTMALDQNAQSRTERATSTVDFFDQEVDRLSAQIDALETRIVKFKLDNAGALPDSLSFRRDELLKLEEQSFQREQRRIQLEEQRRELELQLEQGAFARSGETLSPEDRQIRDLKNNLSQQLGLLTETHPQIVALKARIAALEAGPRTDVTDEGAANAAEFDRRRLERQIQLIGDQLAALEERQKTENARREVMRESISETPQVEVTLNALERRFADLQLHYRNAAAKQAEARTGEKLEVSRQAERFVVIEQAQVPQRPDSPNRMLIAAGGGGASIAIGVGLVVLLELLNSSIRTAGDLQRRVQLRPVVTVPYIQTRAEIRRRRFWLLLLGLVVLVGVPAALFAVDTYYLPLEVLADRLMRSTGIGALIEMIERRF